MERAPEETREAIFWMAAIRKIPEIVLLRKPPESCFSRLADRLQFLPVLL